MSAAEKPGTARAQQRNVAEYERSTETWETRPQLGKYERVSTTWQMTGSPQSTDEQKQSTRSPALDQLYGKGDRVRNAHGPLTTSTVCGRTKNKVSITARAEGKTKTVHTGALNGTRDKPGEDG